MPLATPSIIDAAGLRALAADAGASRTRRALEKLGRRVADGQPLEAAINDPAAGIPPTLAAVVHAGLRAKRLPVALGAYVELDREARELRRSLWVGLTYPLILVLFSVGIVVALAWLLLPSFEGVFTDFDVELPKITVYTLTLSSLLRNFGLWLLVGSIILAGTAYAVCRAILPDDVRSHLLDLLPVVGPARQNLSLSRFCRLLSLLVSGETPLPDALRLAGDAANVGLFAAADVLARQVEAGVVPAEAALQVPQFPRWLAPLLRWHDRGPAFVESLNAAADLCVARSRSHMTLVTLVAEPAVIVCVAITVGFTVFSLFMPLVKLLNELS